MSSALSQFREVWLVDFEFHQPDGDLPEPICMVAREYRTGRTLHVSADQLAEMREAPFSTSADSLFVAYYASAELSCFLALGWLAPERILDLYAEFRNSSNGQPVPCGRGLLGALAYYGLSAIEAAEKDDMRNLAIRGGPFTQAESQALLNYCETDVVALARLLPPMLPNIDLPRAMLRGRYTVAAARIERQGVPIDIENHGRLVGNWTDIQSRLIVEVDRDYGVYVPAGKKINPASRLGAAILNEAEEWGIDPHSLAESVDEVWAAEKVAAGEQQAALKAAREATGLTSKRIADWENAGLDGSTWPGLDATARELAGLYPDLGIGSGYETEAGYDDTDYAGLLWVILRDGPQPPRPKHDPRVLRRAAEQVYRAGAQAVTRRWSFNAERFANWLIDNDIPWPRTEADQLSLSDNTFRQMAKSHPEVAPLRELRHTLGELRLNKLAVGSDGRNRCLLSAFSSRTGRNQPSNSKFIYGPSCWLRGLIKPQQGRAVAYVDWSQQEFGIGAALSGDTAMMAAYSSGDPYLTFAKQAGAVPANATKETHPAERGQYKVCSLAVQYGMGAKSLAESLGQPEARGRELLTMHRQTYPDFWTWSEAAVNHAMLRGSLHTVFGWTIRVGSEANPRSLANFPCQANGAEMLRLACCLATERGIEVCCPVHDALLVEGPADDIETIVAKTQAVMALASRVILDGFELRTDADIVRWPDRYMDDRGVKMWDTIQGILAEIEGAEVVASGQATAF